MRQLKRLWQTPTFSPLIPFGRCIRISLARPTTVIDFFTPVSMLSNRPCSSTASSIYNRCFFKITTWKHQDGVQKAFQVNKFTS